VQRLTPDIRLAELNDETMSAVHAAKIVALGPMTNVDDETLQLHKFVAELARFSLLVPHPDFIRHPLFGEVAGQFKVVAVNGGEAKLSDPTADDLVKHALRMRHMVGEGVDLVITNGAEPGLIWAGGHWLRFEPPAVTVVNDTGAGDVFSTVFAIWRQRGARPLEAAERAMATAARWISGLPLAASILQGPPVPLPQWAGPEMGSASWSEQAL
jgi:sugar/nucleoside kinase (ribokinase family)